MKNEIYCGSTCVKYILDQFKIKYELNNKMIWVTELASFLNKYLNQKVELHYYKSKLVSDYYRLHDLDFDGFKFLNHYLIEDGILKIQKLTKKSLKKEIDNNNYVILCVESKRFNNDSSMSGGHYILILGRKNNLINIVNPQKQGYIIQKINIKKLIKSSKKYGSWRILITN